MSAEDPKELQAKLAAKADEVRKLKESLGGQANEVQSAVNQLLELKKMLAPLAEASRAIKGAQTEEERIKAENIAKAEADKLAARQKKKDAKAAKGLGGGGGGGSPSTKGAAAPATGAAAAKGGPSTGVAAPKVNNKDYVVRANTASPPVLTFIAAKLAQLTVHFQVQTEPGVVLYLPNGTGVILGDAAAARHIARLAPPSRGIYGAPLPTGEPGPASASAAYTPSPAAVAAARSQSSVDEWLDGRADALRAGDMRSLAALNRHLAMRTYMAWHEPSLADAAVFVALAGNAAWEGVKGTASAAKSLPHLARWHSSVAALPAFAQGAEKYLGSKKETGSFDIDLPGAEKGKVVMRFAPEPSGFLHIGHAKAALMGDYFAKHYEGSLILRFDDTNPSNEKEEYEDAIVADVKRLGLKPVRVTHTSDYFAELLKAQTEMIKCGDAYVDASPAEVQQKLRFDRKPSPARDQPVAENLRLWEEMQKATEEGQKCCVRAKMDPASTNGTLRDPTTYRVNLTPHHFSGSKYKVYPTYDFACPWVDAHEGITHALRDRQYFERDAQYHRMAELQGVRAVPIWSFSRLNFKQCLLSKRKLGWFVAQGRVDGWDDPRMPTIQGILRRGLDVEGLSTFILMQGASQNNNLMEWDKIWSENRKVIDPKSVRYTAITGAKAVPFKLAGEGVPSAPEARSILAHKKNPELGNKVKWYSATAVLEQEDALLMAEGEEVTLMDWGNAIVDKIVKDDAGNVTAIEGRLNLQGDVKKTKKKLSWAAEGADNVNVHLVDIDHLITKDALEEDDKLVDGAPCINAYTREAHEAIGEPGLRLIKKGQTIQVERRGFYICDSPYVRPQDPIVMLFVPDGKNMFGYRKPQA